MISYLSTALAADASLPGFSVWDGEVPRYDTNGNAVGPSNVGESWPAVNLEMQEPGFNRTHTAGANAVKDIGIIKVECWATTREEAEGTLTVVVEAFEKQISVYTNVDVSGPPANPNFVFEMTLLTWGCFCAKGYRTANSSLLYRADSYWTCKVHSTSPTTQ